MKTTKQELEIAKQIQYIIESKIHNKNKDIWKENWIWAKNEIENNINNQKVLLLEEQQSGLKISQLHTEGYISALEWILFTFNSYEEDNK
jgi:hypothetical protein